MDEFSQEPGATDTNTGQNTEAVASTETVSPATDYSILRRYPRIKCFLAVQLRPAGYGTLYVGKLSDVGLGGCGIECAKRVEVGSHVALCPLASDGSLWVEGIVVYMRPAQGASEYQIGVRFLEGKAGSPTESAKEFVRFVEESARNKGPQHIYIATLAKGDG